MSITIALAGNPNCGKTTLFNGLTGANQYVGNWPGVTVEKKEGKLKKHDDVIVTDLPGIYSLSPYTLEEVVARKYLAEENPDVVLNIIDGTNLERNLYLTTQVLELGIPVVVAINMMDMVEKNGDVIHTDKLEEELGCKVVTISALKSEGIEEAAEACIQAAKEGRIPEPRKFSDDIESALSVIENEIADRVPAARLRWYAVKIFERDQEILKDIQAPGAEAAIKAVETAHDEDTEGIITDARYQYITSIINDCFKKNNTEKLTTSDKIDKIVTNRILALPIFVVIMFVVYYITVSTIGGTVTDWTNDVLFGEWIQGGAETLLTNMGASDAIISLVVDGILGGIAAPVGFAPQMAIMFFFLAILEDCGYMARVAFIMDRIFRKFGLSGKSFISFMIGTGCGIPAIMSTRTIEQEQDRRMTMITTTFMPCGAKLPVIALISGYIIGDTEAWFFAPCIYFSAIALIIISCIILKKTAAFAGDPAPFVMELPQYHFPTAKNVLLHVWERVWAFLKKAGTILFVCCVVMWFLASYGFVDGSFGMVEETEDCLLRYIGGVLAPLFTPLGFGNWKAVASSLSGFVAKEGILSTMGVLTSIGEEVEEFEVSMKQSFMEAGFFASNIGAVSFLFFNLFDSPCLAAISTLAKEMNSRKWLWIAILFQNIFSYCVALIVYQVGGFLIGEVAFGVGTVAGFVLLAVILYLLFRPDPYKKRAEVTAKAAA